MLFHRHAWLERARAYTPPITRAFTAERAPEEYINKVTFGFTIVEMVCTKCGDLKVVEFHGEPTKRTVNKEI